jgi:hypothetical protein
MKATTYPGCLRTLAIHHDEAARCSPCVDVVRTVDDGEYIRGYNEFNKLVSRKRSKQLGPQSSGAWVPSLIDTYRDPWDLAR